MEGATVRGDESAFEWIEALSDATIVTTDAGIIVRANRMAADLLGASPQALQGVSTSEVVTAPGRARIAAGANHESVMVVRRGETALATEVEWSAGSFEQDRRRFVVHTLREFRARFDFDAGGESVERVDFDAIYQLVFDQLPIGLFHFDTRGAVTACNESFAGIIGSPKRVILGIQMLTLPFEPIVSAVQAALRGERAHWEGDYRSVTGGKTTPVRTDFSPVRNRSGAIIGGIGIIEDVSEHRASQQALRQSEMQLAHADRMASVGTLAAGVAHEINNPLASVLTSLDHALEQLQAIERSSDPGAKAKFAAFEVPLAHARDGADRVRAIVRSLQSFARADGAGNASVDVERVMDASINLAARKFRGRARLVREYAGVSPANGDPARLGQVFVNLLVNAAHAIVEGAPDENEIRVTTGETDDGWITVDVADTGAGVAPELATRVFDPYVSEKPTTEGSGLELAICHNLVKNMGGRITLERTGPGGSSFRVSLPRVREAKDAPRSSRPPRDGKRRLRILIVEDEAILASTLRLALGDRHDIVIANSGITALDLLAKDAQFDVVLCDVMMPGKTGMDVYEALVRDHPALTSRVIFMTGGVYSERAESFFARVTAPRIEKPFSMDEIDKLLRHVGAQRESQPG